MWIEICQTSGISANPEVTPYAGVWIEILYALIRFIISLSLPTRECGLKSSGFSSDASTVIVTPYAGVWIEIAVLRNYNYAYRSLPTRECGLKF